MVGEDKAAIHGPLASCPPNPHPAGDIAGRKVTKAVEPVCPPHRGRRNNQRTGKRVLVGSQGIGGFWQVNPASTVSPVEPLDRTVREDRADGGIDAGQQPLRLPQRVSIENARVALGSILSLPRIDFGKNFGGGWPVIDRQAKGRFGNKGVAAHRLKGGASIVGFQLIVAGNHPDFALVFQAHLG